MPFTYTSMSWSSARPALPYPFSLRTSLSSSRSVRLLGWKLLSPVIRLMAVSPGASTTATRAL